MVVSILLVMDDGLGDETVYFKVDSHGVSILLVMDDGLGEILWAGLTRENKSQSFL